MTMLCRGLLPAAIVSLIIQATQPFQSLKLPFRRSVVSQLLVSSAKQLTNKPPLEYPWIDRRPFEQRTKGPRPARRLNHAFKHLYRHGAENLTAEDPYTFLLEYGGYSPQELHDMSALFPPLLTLSVSKHLYPKIRFLKDTMKVQPSIIAKFPYYFGMRLERSVAPSHAFLSHVNLTGPLLTPYACQEFFMACRSSKHLAALCSTNSKTCTATTIDAFQQLFGRGLLSAARNDLVQANNTWPLQFVNITATQVLKLLISHGANPYERDHRGVTLLHWAAGTNHLDCVMELLQYLDATVTTERDGATALHWAAAGVNSREFGTGGHVGVCHELLSRHPNLVHSITMDGNTALMWAAWSGTLDTVQLLLRHGADCGVRNRNGCTVAHWAASGGDLAVCQYLLEHHQVDFTQPNHGGNTPLTHAVAFSRADVVAWLRREVVDDDDHVARMLAEDFVQWTDGEQQRRRVLDEFL